MDLAAGDEEGLHQRPEVLGVLNNQFLAKHQLGHFVVICLEVFARQARGQDVGRLVELIAADMLEQVVQPGRPFRHGFSFSVCGRFGNYETG